MSKVLGKDVGVYVYDGGIWKLYACGTNCTLTVSTEFIETSVKGDGKSSTFVPTKNSVTGSIEGLTNFGLANTLSLHDLRQKQLAHELLLIRFERTDQTGSDTYVDQFYAYIQESTDTSPNEGMNSFTITLKGSGGLTQIFVPTEVNPNQKVKSLYINKTGTETGYTSFTPAAGALIGKDIVGAWRGQDIVPITSGTPNPVEIKYDSSTREFSWQILLEADEIIHIQYQDI